jgi:hypothetical protein
MIPPLHARLRIAADIEEHGLEWEYRICERWLPSEPRPKDYYCRPVKRWSPAHAVLEGWDVRVKNLQEKD